MSFFGKNHMYLVIERTLPQLLLLKVKVIKYLAKWGAEDPVKAIFIYTHLTSYLPNTLVNAAPVNAIALNKR